MNDPFDILVIGGGIVGVATARAILQRKPKIRLALLEKEPRLAEHTSGRNSGVLHAGYNQKPATLKARLCVTGNRLMQDFCRTHHLPLLNNGILVVARKPEEIETLQELHARGVANAVPGLELIDRKELEHREPRVTGLRALWAPSGASIDAPAVVRRLAEDVRARGGVIFLKEEARDIARTSSGFIVETTTGTFASTFIVNCAGLQADRIAHKMGAGRDFMIVPFRGEYYLLKDALKSPVDAMIYPVPDLRFPFLGIHWTKTVHGEFKVGPNAILAFGRESYRFSDIRPLDCLEWFRRPAFWRMLGQPEFRRLLREQAGTSLSPRRFLEKAAAFVEGVTWRDFQRGPAGIRAQLVDRQGRMVDDLLIEEQNSALHVLNAVSPGLTCSLAFAEYLAEKVAV